MRYGDRMQQPGAVTLRAFALCMVWTFALAGGCGSANNSLEGSISDSFDLSFDRTQLRRINGVTLQLDYIREVEGSETSDIICKVVIDTPEGGFLEGEAVSIIDNNGIIERRAVGGEDFPALELGNITFDIGGNAPGPAKGSFASTFTNGKTLNGTFDTELEDVAF